MKEKTKILKSLIGLKIEYIGFIELFHEPIPFQNSVFITHDKIAFLNIGTKGYQQIFELKSIMEHFENHQNSFKINISSGNNNINAQEIMKKYSSILKINFEVAAIYEYEETEKDDFLNEVRNSENSPSTLHFIDKTGIQNILIQSYEIPGEQSECELKVSFFIGSYFSYSNELKRYSWSELKYINLIGTRPEY